MKIYAVRFARSAEKEFGKLPKPVQLRIGRAIEKLRADPRKGSVRPMVGSTAWRLRVGDYRVVYDIQDGELVVLIIRVGHRKEIYRRH